MPDNTMRSYDIGIRLHGPERNGRWQDISYSPENSIYGEDEGYSTIDEALT